MPRVLFRVVLTDPPSLDNFTSHATLGRPRAIADPIGRRLAEGLSVFATVRQARRNARSYRGHGSHIAELRIPDDLPLTVERTGRQPGHHTIWGDPAELRQCVALVIPVGPDRPVKA